MDLLGWVIFLFALLFSVMMHETGHFVMAKKFGMKCTRYFVGFGPTIWSTWRGETEYGIKALPIGGFVKIIGMHSLDDEHDVADEPRSFRSKPAWQRIVVLSAGSFMHLLLAFVLAVGVLMAIGNRSTDTTRLGTVTPCVASSLTALQHGSCGTSKTKSPADLAGLVAGDKVTAFNGKPVSTWTQLSAAITASAPGTPVTVTVQRGGKTLDLHATLSKVPGRKGSYLGIAPDLVYQTASFWGAIGQASDIFGQELVGSGKAMASLPAALPKLFGKQRADTAGGQVSSVIGVANVTGQVVAAKIGWRDKVYDILLLIAIINLFIGAFNMLPLIPLDGGHVFAIVLERIRAWRARLRGRPDPGLIDMRKLMPGMLAIFAVVVFFSVIVLLADIVNPVSTGG